MNLHLPFFTSIILGSTIAMSPCYADDWTAAGQLYHNVKVVKVEADGVHITYDGGTATVAFADLPSNLQDQFSDPIKASKDLEESSAAGWQTISDRVLLGWVKKVTAETNAASTDAEKLQARTQQVRLESLHYLLSQNILGHSDDSLMEKWVDLVMTEQICEGMPKSLVVVAWSSPDVDTISFSEDGKALDTLNFGNHSSTVFLVDGVVKNIAQTQTVQN